MPVLPDASALGSAPSGNSGRRIVDYGAGIDIGNVGRERIGVAAQTGKGLEALGAGIAKVGEAGMAYARERHYEDLKLATARADAAWMPERINSLKQFGDEDPDYDTAPKRFIESRPGRIKEIAEQYIPDPAARELWSLKAQEDAAKDWATIDAKSRARNNVYLGVTGDESLNALSQTYVEAQKDPGSAHIAEESVKAANGVIDDMVKKGIWTEEQATARRKQFAMGTFSGALAHKDYETQLSTLKGFESALIYRESRGVPTSQNNLGYSGLYQFGAPRLETLGVYKPGASENLKTWSTAKMAEAPGKWTGTFDIPGFPSVKTIKDFLASPDAQRKAFQMHIANIDNEMVKRGLDKFIGQTIQGVKITKEGIEAMAHLGGMEGTDAVLHGRPWKTDANGTSLMQYAKLGAGGKTGDPMADIIDPLHREQMFNGFVDQRYRMERQEEAQKKEQVASTAGNYLQRTLNNDFGTPTQSILDDIKNDENLKKDPETQYRLYQTVEREQAGAAKGEAKTYGGGFVEARQEVIDGKLKDFSDVLKLSADGKLTMQGVHEINSMIQNMRKSPDSSAIEHTKQSMLDYAKKQLVIENPFVPQVKDEKGQTIFSSQFVPTFLFGYQDWVDKGGNPREYLSKANVDKMIGGLRDPNEMARMRVMYGVNAPLDIKGEPAVQRPATVPVENWTKVISAPPLAANGKPYPTDKWGKIVSRLANDPTRPMVDAFNESEVGQRIKGEVVLESLGIPVPPTAAGAR